jgi:hypothetical protein
MGDLQPSRHAFTPHGAQSGIRDRFGAKHCGAQPLVGLYDLVSG